MWQNLQLQFINHIYYDHCRAAFHSADDHWKNLWLSCGLNSPIAPPVTIIRTALSELRKNVAKHLNITKSTTAFHPRSYWLDVEQFENVFVRQTDTSLIARQDTLNLYRGEFLQGTPYVKHPSLRNGCDSSAPSSICWLWRG